MLYFIDISIPYFTYARTRMRQIKMTMHACTYFIKVLAKKTLANWFQFAKFAKVFYCQSFLPYGIVQLEVLQSSKILTVKLEPSLVFKCFITHSSTHLYTLKYSILLLPHSCCSISYYEMNG